MDFKTFTEKYGRFKLLVNPIGMIDGDLMLDIKVDPQKNDVALNAAEFIVIGYFDIYTIKNEAGWRIASVIEAVDVSIIDENENMYSVNDCNGMYMKFFIDSCEIIEIPFGSMDKRINEYRETQKEALEKLIADWCGNTRSE